jgi:MoaA/NifB/PqqE/SkfB family radical SAM enzyme
MNHENAQEETGKFAFRVQTIRGSKLRLEASSACQLRCPSCPTTTGHTHAVLGKNRLRLADFVRLVDDNPWIGEIELSNYGEVFLNPELLGIFQHAYRRNVALRIENGANLNHVRDDVLEGLVRYQIVVLTCSIDGASQESYAQYRIRGDFDRVIANVRRINHWKCFHHSDKPGLIWQFIAFGHNEHEISAARAMAAELGMEFKVKLSWDPDISPTKDDEMIREVTGTGASSRAEYREKSGKLYMERICDQLWESPQVNWDGKILGCCRNFWGEFGGNAFSGGLVRTINGEKMAYARAMLKGEAPAREDIPCTSCALYRERKKAARWITRGEPVAAEDAPAAARAHWQKARKRQERGQTDRTIEKARIVLQLDPGHPGALNLLGQAASSKGRADAAEYYFAKAKAARDGRARAGETNAVKT